MAEISPPSWLDTTLMENGLKKAFGKENLKVLKLETSVANAPGDHYGSQMYRMKLTIQTTPETVDVSSVVVKVFPETKFAEEKVTVTIFDREGKAYSNALPCIFLQLQKAYPELEKLWPEFCFAREEPNWIIVLKDLKCDGYVLGNKFEGLDLNHATLVLKSLAKFHAASLPAMKANKEAFKQFDWSFWSSHNKKVVGKFLEGPFSGLLQALPNWPEFEGKDYYIKTLTAMQDSFLEKVFKVWEKDESKLNVFLHGDSWINNFMFKYGEEGKPTGIKFVDFQISSINSPALDIQYLIFTSVRPDLKFDRIDYFLETYYSTFENTLRKLGHELSIPYDLKDLKRDFEEKYAWGFAVFFCFSPLICAPPEDVFQFDEFYDSETGVSFEKVYRRNNVSEIMIRGLNFFKQKGVL